MAIWESLKSLASGNFKDSASYLFISQDEVNRGRDLDAQLQALNARDLASNTITGDEYQRRVSEIQSNAFEHDGIFAQEGTDVAGGFIQGASDGLNNIQQTVKKSVAGTLNFGFGFIPWQVWALVGIYIGFRLGLFDKILERK